MLVSVCLSVCLCVCMSPESDINLQEHQGHDDDDDDDDDDDNDDDDDDDDNNNDNENIGEDEGDSQKYLQRKEVLHNGKKGDISEECINFYRRMCEKRHGKYRTPAKSARPTEWSSTPKLLNKRPRMGSIKKMKKTLMSSRGHSDREGKQTGAGIMTRAAKRRLEALERENAAASSNTAAAIMSNDKMTAAKEAVEKKAGEVKEKVMPTKKDDSDE